MDTVVPLFSDSAAHWLPLALPGQVNGEAPFGVVCMGRPLVLYRDASGAVRAMEDRCVHRRAPLSLGRITPDGRLQCGYHGWTYDGATGACVAIPNLSEHERVPAHYVARAYETRERDGFVWGRATRGVDAGEPADAASPPSRCTQRFAGSATVAVACDEYVAALADGPHLLMRIAGVRITDYVIADPEPRGGRVGMERGVTWAASRRNHRFGAHYPWTFRLTSPQDGALASVELDTRDGAPMLWASIAIVPAARGATNVLWRGGVAADTGGVGAALFRLWARLRRSPFAMLEHVDARALSKLDVSCSRAWPRPHPQAACAGPVGVDRLPCSRSR
ncbi:Rieske 2Fe-2S domain-containing protein [Burkholderia oklahomensis]|uniref:Rieske 2Fe-2S domain-containing protein n=1 Tax=Burkholderia oklahomensis TaxID=342113 RepID=UPI002651BE88|nr:Rieske 2Fe-2S domain-containing protein [Burkholderia oklahomensis]MDN7675225.1 Rieske 2Fe-2S domain-containing protein [Burkholderia oklahomensis]